MSEQNGFSLSPVWYYLLLAAASILAYLHREIWSAALMLSYASAMVSFPAVTEYRCPDSGRLIRAARRDISGFAALAVFVPLAWAAGSIPVLMWVACAVMVLLIYAVLEEAAPFAVHHRIQILENDGNILNLFHVLGVIESNDLLFQWTPGGGSAIAAFEIDGEYHLMLMSPGKRYPRNDPPEGFAVFGARPACNRISLADDSHWLEKWWDSIGYEPGESRLETTEDSQALHFFLEIMPKAVGFPVLEAFRAEAWESRGVKRNARYHYYRAIQMIPAASRPLARFRRKLETKIMENT